MLRDIKEEFLHIVRSPPERIATETIVASCLIIASFDKAIEPSGISRQMVVLGALFGSAALGDFLKFREQSEV